MSIFGRNRSIRAMISENAADAKFFGQRNVAVCQNAAVFRPNVAVFFDNNTPRFAEG